MIDTQKEQKFKQLLTDNKDMIYRLSYAYLYNKDDIEDLLQEISINIWNSLDKFRNESKISTWIYRIAANTALMHNRKDNKLKTIIQNIEVETYHLPDDDPEEYKEKENQINRLRIAISKLKNQDRLIISLVLEKLKYDEIADIMGMTLSNVGVKINRIKTNLFKLMQENGNG